MKIFLKILLWVAVIALVIFLTLLISSKIAQFESIGAMLDYIFAQIRG